MQCNWQKVDTELHLRAYEYVVYLVNVAWCSYRRFNEL